MLGKLKGNGTAVRAPVARRTVPNQTNTASKAPVVRRNVSSGAVGVDSTDESLLSDESHTSRESLAEKGDSD